MRDRTQIRPCVTMPIDSEPQVYLTGRTDKSTSSREDDIRVRFQGSAGFMPAWMFSWILRFMQSPRASKTNDTRVRCVDDDEYEFISGPVTVRAKKFDVRVAMRVSVSLPEHDQTFFRELDSTACAELEKRIADMRSALNRYDDPKLPDIDDEESRWFESFDSDDERKDDAASETSVSGVA